jgi:hypothetical protein
MRTPRVFVSMGTPYRADYEHFRDELVSLLRNRCHVDPRLIDVNEYPPGSPVHKIREVLSGCDGVLVVCYERTHVTEGLQRRGGIEQRKIVDEKYTTPWNHIGSAMAFSLRIPLYIIAETGLVEEGLVESKVDWYVRRIEFTPLALSSPQVVDSLRAWVGDRVVPNAKRSKALLAAVAKLRLSEMTGEEWSAILAIIASAFGAGAAAARFLPGLFH